jgi:hypothetical protein
VFQTSSSAPTGNGDAVPPQQSSAVGQSGRICVVVYIVTTEDDAAELIAGHCTRYAASQDWVLATRVIRDTDRQLPLDQRPGWKAVDALLRAGRAQGVLTYSYEMISLILAAQEHVTAELAKRGSFLAVSRPQADKRPLSRRRPDAQRAAASPTAGTWPDAFASRSCPTPAPDPAA